jgi:EmrB/QacA subfamily drug resistance transporter
VLSWLLYCSDVDTDSAPKWTLVATILGSSLTFIDATVTNVALPALQADLRASISEVQWVIEAYALFLGALILVGGAMGDQFGRKRVFLAGLVVFTAASILCGLSGSTRALIAARAVQGVGAAFLVPGSLAIISATFSDADRGRAIGVWSGFSSITSAIGPVLGGWLIEHVSWRAVFFLNVPIAAAVFALSSRYMAESRDQSRTARTDWIGAALAVFGLGAIVFGLLEEPRPDQNRSLIAAAMIAGAVSLVLFVIVERRTANAMVPLHLFSSATFTRANILTLLLYAALGMIIFIVPLNLIQVQHYTATAAGAALLPLPVIMLALSRWSGGLIARTGSRLPLTVGPMIAAVGTALYARPGIGGSYWTTFFPAMTVLGFGMALTVAPLTTTVMGAVETEHAGTASGVNNAVARVAGLLAIAILGLVLVSTFDARLEPRLDRIDLTPSERAAMQREIPKMAGAEVDAVTHDERRRTAIERAVNEAFVSAFRVVMLAAAGLACAAAIVGSIRGIGTTTKTQRSSSSLR